MTSIIQNGIPFGLDQASSHHEILELQLNFAVDR
jgi:hypothetical protein